MATIHATRYVPHIGSLWAAIITDWLGYVPNASASAWTWTFDDSSGYREIAISRVIGANTNVFHYIDTAMPADRLYTWDYVQGLPGWMSVPPIMATTAGGKTTLTIWEADIADLRDEIIANYISGTILASGIETYSITPSSTSGKIAYKVWSDGSMIGMDWTTMTSWPLPASTLWQGSVSPSTMGRSPAVPVVGGSAGEGGSTDVSEIVTALQDISRRDVATQLDNGNVTVYNYSGDIVEPP